MVVMTQETNASAGVEKDRCCGYWNKRRVSKRLDWVLGIVEWFWDRMVLGLDGCLVDGEIVLLDKEEGRRSK